MHVKVAKKMTQDGIGNMAVKSSIEELLQLLNISPTPWHAVENILNTLKNKGFQLLDEKNFWKVTPGGKYVVVRGGSSLIAFIAPKKNPKTLKIVGSHTDSPGFKLKPNAVYSKENMTMLGLEIYGAPLLTSWLNRDLGIAGRIIYKDKNDHTQEALINIEDSPVTIPQLAIHLDKNVNDAGPVLNKQEHIAALAALETNKKGKLSFLEELLKEKIPFKSLLAHDLFLYPLEKGAFLGPNKQMIASYRLDNLQSAHAALVGFLENEKTPQENLHMVAFWDHEEVGSTSSRGAHSPFFLQTLERVCVSLNMNREEFLRFLPHSLCLSLDVAHALHPNYIEKHEPRHFIQMDKGVVIKYNAQQRYASDATTAATVIELCEKLKVPFQSFISKGDISSGTTIGPVHASMTGISTVDIGSPLLSMHSCREIISTHDHVNLCKLMAGFFAN
jgi:aspartyl aminopeptidase